MPFGEFFSSQWLILDGENAHYCSAWRYPLHCHVPFRSSAQSGVHNRYKKQDDGKANVAVVEMFIETLLNSWSYIYHDFPGFTIAS